MLKIADQLGDTLLNKRNDAQIQAVKHSEEQQKIESLQEQEEKISLLRATAEVKQTLQETQREWTKKQSSMASTPDDQRRQKVQEQKLDSQALSMPGPSS